MKITTEFLIGAVGFKYVGGMHTPWIEAEHFHDDVSVSRNGMNKASKRYLDNIFNLPGDSDFVRLCCGACSVVVMSLHISETGQPHFSTNKRYFKRYHLIANKGVECPYCKVTNMIGPFNMKFFVQQYHLRVGMFAMFKAYPGMFGQMKHKEFSRAVSRAETKLRKLSN